MNTRMSGMSTALAAAVILSLGSSLPASHGHGGGGGGHSSGGGGHSGGHSFGGGSHHMGGGFSGGSHHFGGGGFSGSTHHFGGSIGGGSHHFSAPQQRHYSAPQSSGHSIQNFGSSTRHFNSGNVGGTFGGNHQTMQQPSFSTRHNGSNLATHNHGNSTLGSANRGLTANSHHITAPAAGTQSFSSRHTAQHLGTGTRQSAIGGFGGTQRMAQGGGLSSRSTHHFGSSVQGGSFASRHNGQVAGSAPSMNARSGSGFAHHGAAQHLSGQSSSIRQANNIAAGAVGSRAGQASQRINAHHMWNNVGRSVGTGLASFHSQHHVGNAVLTGGVNRGGSVHNHHHGYYGNNFRTNRIWYGVGTGFWPYYAWNYRPIWGYGGYGYGSGLWGWGRGWGFSIGNPGWSFGIGNWGGWGGYGGWGFGRYGYGMGYGYGGYGYNSYCAYNPGYSIYSNAYTYVPTSSYNGYGTAPVAVDYSVQSTLPANAPVQVAQIDSDPTVVASAQTSTDDLDFGAAGEAEFKASNYSKAAKLWRHAVLDDPKNGVLVLMLGQALFASGQFDEAAGATQQGMLLLKEEDWGVVVANYRELYTRIGDYTTQLRVLEKARKDKPEEPALRFLLGYHYAYLGFPAEAIKELDKATSLAPQDELAKKLKSALEAKQKGIDKSKPAPPPVPQP